MTGITDTEHDGWQTHSLTFLEMAFRSDRQGRPAYWSGMGQNVGACKDSITFFLMVRDHIIDNITYELDGCLNTNACANAVAAIAEGPHAAAGRGLGQISPQTPFGALGDSAGVSMIGFGISN